MINLIIYNSSSRRFVVTNLPEHPDYGEHCLLVHLNMPIGHGQGQGQGITGEAREFLESSAHLATIDRDVEHRNGA